ncbi:Endosulfine-domain-containing protein [Acaromyces ingoldii]|uniref:mRNA stability protein n=1 Tax=Acaromyces ingoldii TaxID=215250 RepID=A0A316YPZ4_9BASI|nr:Endosulfine-domain-containing protein [Acaromyces ingoldii]PWN90113.1 Endosulfine-domain-containing protein [Acaromyces ingoldii]
MIPAQRNKIDISSLTEEEQKVFRLYGKLPNRKDLLGNKLKERKYFDSGDYALSKAGKAPQQSVGTAIPNPETIPHASTVSSPPNCTAAPSSLGQSVGAVPVAVPNASGIGRSPPQVSAFPTATGNGLAGSPAKESSLGKEAAGADDLMEE